jgi:hypothetical protein
LVTVIVPPLEVMAALLTRLSAASPAVVLIRVKLPPLRVRPVEVLMVPPPLRVSVPALRYVVPV